MTTNEIRKLIAGTESSEWFNTVNVRINFPHIGFDQTLTGITSIHKLLEQQISGWEKYGEDIPAELKDSKQHFIHLKSNLEAFINSYSNQESSSLNYYWANTNKQFESSKNYFTYDSPETEFLIQLYQHNPLYFPGAYNFIIDYIQINSQDNLTGNILAYEFKTKSLSELTKRKDKERSSINSIRNDLRKQLSEAETQLEDHLINANKEFSEYSKRIDTIKEEKESLFDDWFNESKDAFSSFDTESKTKIGDLEKTYEELLRLKKPAEYWSSRATKLKKEGWSAIYWLIGLVVFACITLYSLLWLTPEGMLLSFIKGQASAIKWSVIYITFISFLAFGIKSLNKVAFSTFHLARDAEEREQLTYVYLSLIKESAVDEKDKTLIFQSLFSRADTGLLKDDSSPTMPNDITSKLFNK